jgi:hypothetical protein
MAPFYVCKMVEIHQNKTFDYIINTFLKNKKFDKVYYDLKNEA